MLSNKTILITGGTSTLGEAYVLHALKDNANVFFSYYANRAKADMLAEHGAHPLLCDLSTKQAIISLYETIAEQTPVLDILINNAALVDDHTLWNMSEDAWDAVITINLKAPIALSYATLPLLKKSKSAKVFNIISRVGLMGGFGQANYAASKDGLIEFTKILAIEYAAHGICVNGINPGFMLSRMTADMPEESKRQNKNASVLRSYSDPHEVAAFLAWLSSDASTQVSGQIFHYESRMMD